jgi:hypothetical protein
VKSKVTDTQRLRALSIGRELYVVADEADTIKSPVAVTFTDAYGCEITTWHGADGYEHVVTTTRRGRR